jgi:hypothetical protein
MVIKNPTDLLISATKLPAAIESRLPSGAPKLSAMLVDTATKLPRLPNFPVTLPDLPEIPLPGAPKVQGVEVTPVAAAAPAGRVAPNREIVPLVFE